MLLLGLASGVCSGHGSYSAVSAKLVKLVVSPRIVEHGDPLLKADFQATSRFDLIISGRMLGSVRHSPPRHVLCRTSAITDDDRARLAFRASERAYRGNGANPLPW
jgi:hypothetical protein